MTMGATPVGIGTRAMLGARTWMTMGATLMPEAGITPRATKSVTSDNNNRSGDDNNGDAGCGGLVGGDDGDDGDARGWDDVEDKQEWCQGQDHLETAMGTEPRSGVGTTTGVTNSISKGYAGSWGNAGVHTVGGDKAEAKAGGDADARGLGNLEGDAKGRD